MEVEYTRHQWASFVDEREAAGGGKRDQQREKERDRERERERERHRERERQRETERDRQRRGDGEIIIGENVGCMGMKVGSDKGGERKEVLAERLLRSKTIHSATHKHTLENKATRTQPYGTRSLCNGEEKEDVSAPRTATPVVKSSQAFQRNMHSSQHNKHDKMLFSPASPSLCLFLQSY